MKGEKEESEAVCAGEFRLRIIPFSIHPSLFQSHWGIRDSDYFADVTGEVGESLGVGDFLSISIEDVEGVEGRTFFGGDARVDGLESVFVENVEEVVEESNAVDCLDLDDGEIEIGIWVSVDSDRERNGSFAGFAEVVWLQDEVLVRVVGLLFVDLVERLDDREFLDLVVDGGLFGGRDTENVEDQSIGTGVNVGGENVDSVGGEGAARLLQKEWAVLAPNDEIRAQITAPLAAVKTFAKKVHQGEVAAPNGRPFTNLLIIGIGGSALGPQLIYEALGAKSPLATSFLDNTDPAGIDRTLADLGDGLANTLAVVISKSGGTPETRNGMLEARHAFEAAGLDFAKHAVAITGDGSKLSNYAKEQGFLTTFPMADWVGGRTSVLSTVGLVPMALQGIDLDAILSGAAAMDEHTRSEDVSTNAALLLALAWHHEGKGKGEKDMVVLPYKDSLVLFSKYLQQLVMESLGKELDLDGNLVNQGLAVYGNKGSTDQHAYVQQLRDGVHNFFATFIEVRQGRAGGSLEVEPGVTSADFLQGFLRGTRKALYQNGRHSITLSIPDVTPNTLGQLIALFERTVSLYASLVNINAYHQPGVEAGKAAAGVFLTLLSQARSKLAADPKTAEEIASEIKGDPEEVYHALTHLAANGNATVSEGPSPATDTFRV